MKLQAAPPTTRRRLATWAGTAALTLLTALLAWHAVGVLLDFRAAALYPFQIDYGEGIVWQQAALIPGPRAFGTSVDLPFIVFHYPPLYYVVTRAVQAVAGDWLMAGRLVSTASAVLLVPLVAALVITATRQPISPRKVATAFAAGLLVLCLHAVRNWGVVMRVDMLAIALGLLGVLVGARSRGRFLGTTLALLLCLASVFTKQTQLPAGIAVFVVALICNPRGAIGAALVAAGVGVGATLLLQTLTGGGFLLNVVGYNLNTYDLMQAWRTTWNERSSAPFLAFMGLGAAVILFGLVQHVGLSRLRNAERAWIARAMVLIHFCLAALMLGNLAKLGSSFNYFLDTLTIGGVLIGIVLCDIPVGTWRISVLAASLALSVQNLPFRQLADEQLAAQAAELRPVVARIAAAAKPVASDDMVLVMRAGKSLVYEPAIVQELSKNGRWDPQPLLDMIRAGGFAFFLGGSDGVIGGPQINAALRESYPRIEQAAPNLWLHLPPE
ncbi:MAG: hypothetical protein NVS2B11_10790 [Acetobacteraceae bacterium]